MTTVVKIKRMSDDSELVKEEWFELDKEYCEIAGIECDEKHWGKWYHMLEFIAYFMGNQMDQKTYWASQHAQPLNRGGGYQFTWKQCIPALFGLLSLWHYSSDTLEDFEKNLKGMTPTIKLFEKHAEEFYLDIRF